MTCPGNDGALFVFLNLGAGVDGGRLTDRLVHKYDMLVVPGRFFDRPGHLRMSFALPPDELGEVLQRLGRALDETRQS